MSKFLGKSFTSNSGLTFTVVECIGGGYFHIRFEDGTIVSSYYSNFTNGKVANMNVPRVYGVGYLGYGEFSVSKDREVYTRWLKVLERCYSAKKKLKCPSYTDCYMDDSWHCFQNFAKDFYNLLGCGGDFSWQIDKDVLVKGNKKYSYDTCLLLPEEVNKCFVNRAAYRGAYPVGVTKAKKKFRATLNNVPLGTYNSPEEAFLVYKVQKESQIRGLAEKWKEKLSIKAYNALMHYEVLITD